MARYLLKRKFLENETDNSPLEYKNTTFYLKVNLRKRSSSLLTSLNSKASEVNLTKDINEEVWKWNSGTSGDNTNSALLIGHYPDESYAASVAYFVVPILILISLFAITMMVWTIIEKRKKWDELRHRLVPVYSFSPGEE